MQVQFNSEEPQPSEQAKVLNEAFDATGIKFLDRSAALAELKADGREITFNNDGTASVTYDGEANVPIADALKRLAYDRRDLIDGRTLPREGVGSTRPGTDSKANYQSLQEKTRYIEQHGLEMWENLPRTGVLTNEVVTFEDWKRLPIQEKARRINADPDCIRKLKPAVPVSFICSAKINHQALEKLKAVRPNARLGRL